MKDERADSIEVTYVWDKDNVKYLLLAITAHIGMMDISRRHQGKMTRIREASFISKVTGKGGGWE